ncbi:hypothetical protein OROMI_000712 [Orobanche minor]
MQGVRQRVWRRRDDGCTAAMIQLFDSISIRSEEISLDDLMDLVVQIVAFHMKHNAEPEAVRSSYGAAWSFS